VKLYEQQSEETMETNSFLAVPFLILIWVWTAGIEYHLATHFRLLFSLATGVALAALVGELARAPEGYEDENGFHFGDSTGRSAVTTAFPA
jgi:hypothetical protein